MFEFFRLWLIVVFGATAVAGAVGVLFVGPLFALIGRGLDRPFWPAAPDTAARKFQSWAYSVTLATLAGWSLSLSVLVANAYATRQLWVWWSIAGGVALWFTLDTGRSIYHRVFLNAIGNVAFLVIVAIPLFGTFVDFH
jgi:hypothetical protein